MKFHFIFLLVMLSFLNSVFAAGNLTPEQQTFFQEAQKGLSADLSRQLITDFQELLTMRGTKASPLNLKIFDGRSVNGANYFSFVSSRISSFDQSACGGPPVAACNYFSPTMSIAPGYSDCPQIERISFVIHESRHSEEKNNYWTHVGCPALGLDGQPIIGYDSHMDLADLPACDDTAYGAYGVQYIFLKNIANHCETCSDKIKMDAKIYSDSFIHRIVDPASAQELNADK